MRNSSNWSALSKLACSCGVSSATHFINLPPLLCGFLGKSLVDHGHDFVKQLAEEVRICIGIMGSWKRAD